MKLKFLPTNIEIECAKDETIFQAAKRANVKIPSACFGVGTCGLCRIKVISGNENLNPFTKTEVRHLGNNPTSKIRLSCKCRCIGGGLVEVEVK